jgi:hypothetical protein
VVDYLWYRKNVPGAYPDSLGFDVIDEWGRMIPDPDRWTSSKDGKGFTEVAKKVHSMGLKFGIHVMRGLSRQAYDANTLILDTTTVLFFIINQDSFFSHLLFSLFFFCFHVFFFHREKYFFSFPLHAQIAESCKLYHHKNRLVR